jgi:anaerobic ribonucleoside-triphosphate reductase activating protein
MWDLAGDLPHFDQPGGVLALVMALRARGCGHVCVYSGFTLEELRERASRRPAVGALLEAIDMLVDGRYVASLADGAGAWTGSANQRTIDLAAMRRESAHDPPRGTESG